MQLHLGFFLSHKFAHNLPKLYLYLNYLEVCTCYFIFKLTPLLTLYLAFLPLLFLKCSSWAAFKHRKQYYHQRASTTLKKNKRLTNEHFLALLSCSKLAAATACSPSLYLWNHSGMLRKESWYSSLTAFCGHTHTINQKCFPLEKIWR